MSDAKLADLFEGAPEEAIGEIACAPELVWSELRSFLDGEPRAVETMLEHRFEGLHQSGRLEQLWREASDPIFLRDALAHAAVAKPALQALAVLAWHTPDALRLHGILRKLPYEHGLRDLMALLEEEIECGQRLLRLRASGQLAARRQDGAVASFPESLLRVFGNRALATPRARRRAMSDASWLLGEPALLVAYCDRIARLDPWLGATLEGRLRAEIPPDRADGAHLSADLELEMCDAFGAISGQTAGSRFGEGAFEAARIATAMFATINGRSWLARLAGGPMVSPDYAERVRVELAFAIAAVGVPLSVVVAAMEQGGAAAHLASHKAEIRGDTTLHLFGTLAAVLRAYARAASVQLPPLSAYR